MTPIGPSLPRLVAGHYTLRPWTPGDGLTCVFAGRAARHRPCGRPVAVRQVVGGSYAARGPAPRREVVCAFHLPGQMSGGDIAQRAEAAARERVVVAHWDDYQQALREALRGELDRLVDGLDDSLKQLVLDALTDDDHDRGAATAADPDNERVEHTTRTRSASYPVGVVTLQLAVRLVAAFASVGLSTVGLWMARHGLVPESYPLMYASRRLSGRTPTQAREDVVKPIPRVWSIK